jgi:hypothetical protein
MSEERKTLHQRIAELLKRHEQSRPNLRTSRPARRILDRKLDTRRKIILGAAVQAHAKLNARFREELRKAMLAGDQSSARHGRSAGVFSGSCAPTCAPAAPICACSSRAPAEDCLSEPPSGAAPA